MAAFTGSPVSAPDYVKETTAPVLKTLAPGVVQIKKFSRWTHTATQGAGTGVVYLGTLPAGEYVIYPHLSYLSTTQMAANADVHVGFNAFRQIDGTLATADDNAVFDNEDSGGGVVAKAGTLAPVVISAAEPIRVEAMVDTGNIEADDTIDLYLAFAKLR
jgi:hypothetical protein